MRATTAIFDEFSFVGAVMTSKTVVTKAGDRKSDRTPPQDCFGSGIFRPPLRYTGYE